MKESKLKLNILSEEKKYFLFFFAFITLYNFIFVNKCHLWHITQLTYTFHLVDYSFGYCTKFFVGAFYHLFFKEVIPKQVEVFETVLIIAFFIVLSFILAKLLTRFEDTKEKNVFTVLCIFIISGPCSFGIFTENLGMYDSYWLYFTVIFFCFLNNRYLKYLIPFVIVIVISINYASLISYVPVYFVIMALAYLFADKKDKRDYAVLLVISLAVTLAATIYFLNDKNYLLLSYEEFGNELVKRNRFEGGPNEHYFQLSFYDKSPDGYDSTAQFINYLPTFLNDKLPAYLSSELNIVIGRIHQHIVFHSQNKSSLFDSLGLFCIMLPVYAVITGFWVYKIKSVKKRLNKLVFAFMIALLPLTIIIFIMLATDVGRWFTHDFLCQCIVILYIFYKDKSSIKYFVNLSEKGYSKLLVIYYFIYSITYYTPFY